MCYGALLDSRKISVLKDPQNARPLHKATSGNVGMGEAYSHTSTMLYFNKKMETIIQSIIVLVFDVNKK